MSFRGEARVRQRNVGSPLKRMNALRWLFGAVALSVSLVLTLSPLVLAPTAAAPPEAIQEATKSSDITPDSGTDTERPPEAETPPIRDTQDQLVSDVAPLNRDNGDDGSVRLRGVEAPVQLEQQEGQGADQPQETTESADTQENDEHDPGDGRSENNMSRRRNGSWTVLSVIFVSGLCRPRATRSPSISGACPN